MIRIALIGAGSHSELHHGPSLRDCVCNADFDIELVGVCDLDGDRAARYAKSFGFSRSYTSIYHMLDLEWIDAIIAVIPIQETRWIVGELLVHGIPLFLGKPPGQSAIDTVDLCRLAAKYSTPTMVSFNKELERELPTDTPLHVASGCLAETETFIRAVSGEVPYSPVLAGTAASLEAAISLDALK